MRGGEFCAIWYPFSESGRNNTRAVSRQSPISIGLRNDSSSYTKQEATGQSKRVKKTRTPKTGGREAVPSEAVEYVESCLEVNAAGPCVYFTATDAVGLERVRVEQSETGTSQTAAVV